MPKTLQNLDSETRRYLAVSTGQTLGIFVPALVPLLTGYGIDSRGLTFSEVGSIWTITFLSRGIGALAATVIILKLPKRHVLLNCVITSCLIHSLAPLIPNDWIKFFSFPAGFVDGVILATAISAIAE